MSIRNLPSFLKKYPRATKITGPGLAVTSYSPVAKIIGALLVGTFLGLAAFFLISKIGLFSNHTITPVSQAQAAATKFLAGLTGGVPLPGPLLIKEIKPISNGIEVWTAEISGTDNPAQANLPPLFVLNGGNIIFIGGGAFQDNGSTYQPLVTPPGPKNCRMAVIQPQLAKADPQDQDPSPMDNGTLIVFASLRCHACASLASTIERTADSAGAGVYTKFLVDAKDAPTMRALAVIQALQKVADIREFRRLRSLLNHLLAGGMGEEDLASTLDMLAKENPNASIQAALRAQPDESTIAAADRMRSEAEQVGVASTPTIIANGHEVKPAEPAKLEQAILKALSTPSPTARAN